MKLDTENGLRMSTRNRNAPLHHKAPPGRAKKLVDKENVASLANQQVADALAPVTRKRGRPPKASVTQVQPPELKKTSEPALDVPVTTKRLRGRPTKVSEAEESVADTIKDTQTKETPHTELETKRVRGRRGQPEVADKIPSVPEKAAAAPSGRRKEKEAKETENVAPTKKDESLPEEVQTKLPVDSGRSTHAQAITTPAIAISDKCSVPFQRSPVYLTNLPPQKSPVPILLQTPKVTAAPSVQTPSPSMQEDPFRLAPLKPSRRREKRTLKANTSNSAPPVDDVYGFEFNESQEPPKKVAKQAKTKRVVKPKGTTKRVKKPSEPVGIRLWDDKHLKKAEKQIKVNVINRDFKAPQKPLPPLPQVRNHVPQTLTTLPEPDLPMPEPLRVCVERSSASGSPLMPWRYSTIRHESLGPSLRSLNDSNGENVSPSAGSVQKSLPATRPLHTLQPQRSPMKELNPQETILVPRPVGKRSPWKRSFGVENNFGFDSDEGERENENIEVKRRKIEEKIDSLKKFRHSLNVSNSSSPLGPLRFPMRPKEPEKRPLKVLPAIRNIFTSTPQQMKIKDAFQASTPIASSSKKQPSETEGPNHDEGLKLFESLTFEAPPKRNYSINVPRTRKRVNFLGYSDDECSEDEQEAPKDDSATSPVARRHRLTKKSKALKEQEEKLNEFADAFNSMCEEVDQYELVIE